MRREICFASKAYSAASYATILENWRYRQGGTVSPMDAERIEVLYAEEHAHHGGEAAPAADRP